MDRFVRLRLAEVMERKGWTPSDLARCCRLPTSEVLRLIQPITPRTIRLQVLGALANVLEVRPGDLLERVHNSLAVEVSVSSGPFARELARETDSLDDLEQAWAREFPDDARRDADAETRYPFLYAW